MCPCIYAHLNTYIHLNTYTPVYTNVHTPECTLVCTDANPPVSTSICMLSCVYECVQLCACPVYLCVYTPVCLYPVLDKALCSSYLVFQILLPRASTPVQHLKDHGFKRQQMVCCERATEFLGLWFILEVSGVQDTWLVTRLHGHKHPCHKETRTRRQAGS